MFLRSDSGNFYQVTWDIRDNLWPKWNTRVSTLDRIYLMLTMWINIPHMGTLIQPWKKIVEQNFFLWTVYKNIPRKQCKIRRVNISVLMETSEIYNKKLFFIQSHSLLTVFTYIHICWRMRTRSMHFCNIFVLNHFLYHICANLFLQRHSNHSSETLAQ